MDANFKNELAVVVRKNVRELMRVHKIKQIKELNEFIVTKGGADNYQRLNNAFGRSARYAPTEELITLVELAFEMEEGSLVKKRNINMKTIPPAMIVSEMIPIQCQIGETKIETKVDDATARKLLELIVLGEKT